MYVIPTFNVRLSPGAASEPKVGPGRQPETLRRGEERATGLDYDRMKSPVVARSS
jgi:hypothetical protein